MSLRHALLAMALVATLVATFWPGTRSTEARNTVQPVLSRGSLSESRRPDAPEVARLVHSLHTRTDDAEESINLFATRSWTPPLPMPQRSPAQVSGHTPPPVTAPAPTVPAVPFRYVGRYESGSETFIFLEYQQQTLTVKAGESLPGSWRAQKIEPNRLTLLFEPLNETKSLSWPESP